VDTIQNNNSEEPDLGFVELGLRTLKIMFQLIAVYCFADQVSPFFYQQF
jgi:hypothetical protein